MIGGEGFFSRKTLRFFNIFQRGISGWLLSPCRVLILLALAALK